MYIWISGLPKTTFCVAALFFLPVIALVDAIGYLSGRMKVGTKETWNDELLRITHDARSIEVGVGLMNIAYLGGVIISFLTGVSIFAPMIVPHWVLLVLSPIVATYTLSVVQWSVAHEVDPINGTRRLTV